MNVLDAIEQRRTVPPVKMSTAALSRNDINLILKAGGAAPDHGKMRPWRFIVVEGDARQKLGNVFAAAVMAEQDNPSEAEIEKQRSAPLRAGLLVIVTALMDQALGKHPPVERIASAASACQNMLLAAHALGLAGKWATGKNAASAMVKASLDIEPDDEIVGILYFGAYAHEHPPTERPDVSDVVINWKG